MDVIECAHACTDGHIWYALFGRPDEAGQWEGARTFLDGGFAPAKKRWGAGWGENEKAVDHNLRPCVGKSLRGLLQALRLGSPQPVLFMRPGRGAAGYPSFGEGIDTWIINVPSSSSMKHQSRGTLA